METSGRIRAAAERAARRLRELLAGDGSDERRHGGDVLALHDSGRHRAVAVLATSLDRILHEALGRLELVEVRADLAVGVGGGEHVAARAVLAEYHATVLLLLRQLDRRAVGARDVAVVVADEDQHRHGHADRDVEDGEHDHRGAAAPTALRLQRRARAAWPTAQRDEEQHEADNDPKREKCGGGEHGRCGPYPERTTEWKGELREGSARPRAAPTRQGPLPTAVAPARSS